MIPLWAWPVLVAVTTVAVGLTGFVLLELYRQSVAIRGIRTKQVYEKLFLGSRHEPGDSGTSRGEFR